MANLSERGCIYDRWQLIMMIRVVSSSELPSYFKLVLLYRWEYSFRFSVRLFVSSFVIPEYFFVRNSSLGYSFSGGLYLMNQ